MLGRLLTLFGAVAFCATTTPASDRFEWASPLPHRQSWIDFASGNGKLVGLTEACAERSVFVSADGRAWQPASTPPNLRFLRVIHANDRFIAVGSSAMVATSRTGEDWEVRRSDPTKGSLFDIAAGNGVYVAVGYASIGYVSRDLVNWEPIFGLGDPYQSVLRVKFGNGRFVAIGQNGKLLTSPDGAAWTAQNWPGNVTSIGGSTYDGSLAFNNGQFVLSSMGSIASSPDGIHWTLSPNSFRGNVFAAGAQGFVAVEGASVYQSDDGLAWTGILNDPNVNSMEGFSCAAAFGGSNLLVAGRKGLLSLRTDGSNWETIVGKTDFSKSKIAFGNGVFVRANSQAGVSVSMDGSHWEAVPNAPILRTLTFGNNLWVGITASGQAAYSNDGRAWEIAAFPAQSGGEIRFADGLFVVDAAGGVATSADGRTWRRIAFEGAQSARVVGNINGRWCAIVDGCRSATSDDGENWTIHPANQYSYIYRPSFAAGNGRFVVIGGGGMGYGSTAWSSDGITWHREQTYTGTTHQEESLTFGNGQFLMTDSYGGIYVSTDGANWSGQRQAPVPFHAAAFGNGQWLVAGSDSVLRSAAPAQPLSGPTLQLARKGATAWEIILTGTAGETYRVESATEISGQWNLLETITMPAGGLANVPLTSGSPAAFFRAVSI